MKGYEFDIEIKPGVKGLMHRPIPIKSQQLLLLHQQLDEWIASGHARLLTRAERAHCYRASALFFKTEKGKLRMYVDLVAYPMPDMDAIRRDLAGLDVYVSVDVRSALNQILLSLHGRHHPGQAARRRPYHPRARMEA
jgi:hypothetical protein